MAVNLMKVRTGSKDSGLPGTVVNQTLTLTNRSEYEITNVSIKDIATEGISFNNNSVVIDGASYTGYNPFDGFKLPNSIIANSSATITYKITILENPPKLMETYSIVTYSANGEVDIEENSNTYQIELDNGDMTIVKTSNKSATKKGDIFTYQVVIENTGTVTNTNVNFIDILPDDIQFVSGSVKINGQVKQDLNPIDGFSVGNIRAKENLTITFDVKVL